MSYIPLSLVLNEMSRPVSLFDQNFGLGLLNDDLYMEPVVTRSGYLRPWRHLTRQQSGVSNIASDKDAFQVNLDVQQFKPEEISVKTVDSEGSSCIVVEGKHEEKQDEHGFVSRHFVRRYVLPADAQADKIQCKLSSDGVLNVSVPKKALPAHEANERVILITQTGAPARSALKKQPADKVPVEVAKSSENTEEK